MMAVIKVSTVLPNVPPVIRIANKIYKTNK